MHIEKRKLKGKIKYYLAHSFREGSKVHKFTKYLGQDLKPKLLHNVVLQAGLGPPFSKTQPKSLPSQILIHHSSPKLVYAALYL